MKIEQKNILGDLTNSLVQLEMDKTVKIVQLLNEQKVDPSDIFTACEQALTEIGDLYAAQKYYIAGLIMAGEIMERVTALVAPRMAEEGNNILKGKVMIGTVKGDIHDLGKNMAGALLAAFGFEVYDLGVDVPPKEFVQRAKTIQPDIIGLSVLLTSCYPALGETIELLNQERGDKATPSIIISGSQISDEHKEFYHADYYAVTAFETKRICELIVRQRLLEISTPKL